MKTWNQWATSSPSTTFMNNKTWSPKRSISQANLWRVHHLAISSSTDQVSMISSGKGKSICKIKRYWMVCWVWLIDKTNTWSHQLITKRSEIGIAWLISNSKLIRIKSGSTLKTGRWWSSWLKLLAEFLRPEKGRKDGKSTLSNITSINRSSKDKLRKKWSQSSSLWLKLWILLMVQKASLTHKNLAFLKLLSILRNSW